MLSPNIWPKWLTLGTQICHFSRISCSPLSCVLQHGPEILVFFTLIKYQDGFDYGCYSAEAFALLVNPPLKLIIGRVEPKGKTQESVSAKQWIECSRTELQLVSLWRLLAWEVDSEAFERPCWGLWSQGPLSSCHYMASLLSLRHSPIGCLAACLYRPWVSGSEHIGTVLASTPATICVLVRFCSWHVQLHNPGPYILPFTSFVLGLTRWTVLCQ